MKTVKLERSAIIKGSIMYMKPLREMRANFAVTLKVIQE